MNKEKNILEIAEILQDYKKFKEEENKLGNELALEKVFGENLEARQAFEKNLKSFDKAKKENNAQKKDYKEAQQQLQDKLSALILEACKDENGDIVSEDDTIDLPQIASVQYTVQSDLDVVLNSDTKHELIEQFIEEDMLDMLDVNVDALKKYSSNVYEQLGHHVTGVISHPVVKTTIRVKK